MNSIILSTPEIKTLQETGELVKRIAIKPQPESCILYYEPRLIDTMKSDIVFKPYMNMGEPCDLPMLKPLYQKGEIIYVREMFCPLNEGYEKIYLYKASKETYSKYFKVAWHSPVTMPREAARLFPVVEDVSVEQDGDWYWKIKLKGD